jgi:rhodanese-related sulfurtransferase
MAQTPDAKSVTTAELNDGLNMGSSLQVVNVLGSQFAALGMIRYSRRIPLDELERRFKELDKGRSVVVYGAGPGSSDCRRAAELLTEKGFKVSAYPGGLEEWRAAGLPMDMPAA